MSRRFPVLVTAAAVVLLPAPAVAADELPSPGAPGIGDPYFPLDGNGGYDVEHYDLDLRYDPATDVLSGTATVEARATQALSSFHLDLQGLEVEEVTVDGDAATWTRDGGQELVVTPGQALRDGRSFTVAVTYSGVPETLVDELGAAGFFHTDDGALVIGQPDVAATWFPANDHPSDAASVDVAITVPPGLEGVSNGELEGTETTDDGWTTWEWRAREPMATYLVTLAVGEFDLREYRDGDLRFWDAIDADAAAPSPTDPQGTPVPVADTARAVFDRQPEMVEFLSATFGPYPFRTAGGIVDEEPRLAFALENQTRPVYSAGFFTDKDFAESVVVHELTHQWYGDSVRIAAWQHIWLNEGIATYAEWLWLDHEGEVPLQQSVDAVAAIPAEDPFWGVTIDDPGSQTNQLFSPAVYLRGGMTIHALRQEVGEEAFGRILREWASSRAGETVTTADFIALAEQESGRQLEDFFRTWLSTPERPATLR
jgi:aminopeptidase N